LSLRRLHPQPSSSRRLVIPGIAEALCFILPRTHWPTVNADESIINLMASHILYQGEPSIFFQAQKPC
jgi:hypothetical protein